MQTYRSVGKIPSDLSLVKPIGAGPVPAEVKPEPCDPKNAPARSSPPWSSASRKSSNDSRRNNAACSRCWSANSSSWKINNCKSRVASNASREKLLTRLSDVLGTSLTDWNERQGDELSGRERILIQARALFITRGFLDVSMREIAEAAGLRKATIYHHFRDKEELFIAVTLQGMAELRAAMQASLVGQSGLPARLEELAFTQLSMSRGTGMRLAQDFRDHIPESRHAEMHAALEKVLALDRTVFEDAAAVGELSNIEPALAASGFFHIMISWMRDFPAPIPTLQQDPRTLAQAAVRLLLYGVASADLRARS